MKKFVIISDTSCDLERALREKYDIDYIPMHVILNDKEYLANLDWEEISVSDFYNAMRDGGKISSAQIVASEYEEKFVEYIKQGYDVLYIGCSSAISASINAAKIVAEKLQAEYADTRVICIDSLKACYALGFLCIVASKLRAQGKTLDEVVEWIEVNKCKFHQEGTADKLTYLRRAGRLSASSAFFGGLLNIKPIVVFDAKGRNCGIEKVKGRTTSLNRLVERFKERYVVDSEFPEIFIGHADCLEEAEILKQKIIDSMGDDKLNIHIGYVSSAVGSACGPGMIAIYFYGKEITLNKD